MGPRGKARFGMGTSRGPRAADVRAMLRLSHVLHTSADAISRKQSFLSGLCDLLDADGGVNVVAHVTRPRSREEIVSVIKHGSGAACEKQLLSGCFRGGELGAREPFPPPPGLPAWRPVAAPNRASRSRKLRHCLWTPAPASNARVVACVCLSRSDIYAHPFLARERMLLHMAHVEMSWIYQSDLMPSTGIAADLSPRQRQTLQFLLAGHSEKEIAEFMRLSRNTVHHHVKALHRHFDVSTRSELLARWVR